MSGRIFGLALFLAPSLIGLGLSSAANAADETVTLVARLSAAPGHEADAKAYLQKAHDFVMKTRAPLTYKFFQSKKDPTQFFTYEIYSNQAEFDEHKNSVMPAFRKEAGPPPEGTFNKPPEIDVVTEFSE